MTTAELLSSCARMHVGGVAASTRKSAVLAHFCGPLFRKATRATTPRKVRRLATCVRRHSVAAADALVSLSGAR